MEETTQAFLGEGFVEIDRSVSTGQPTIDRTGQVTLPRPWLEENTVNISENFYRLFWNAKTKVALLLFCDKSKEGVSYRKVEHNRHHSIRVALRPVLKNYRLKLISKWINPLWDGEKRELRIPLGKLLADGANPMREVKKMG